MYLVTEPVLVMVIKDLLSKVSPNVDPNSPEVRALREKLSKLNTTKTPSEAPEPPKKNVSEDEKLLNASLDEQKAFAMQKNPSIRLQNEKTHNLIAQQVSELVELVSSLNKKIVALEQAQKHAAQERERLVAKNQELVEKMNLIDARLEKFMGLYEVITNQFNPFADSPIPSISSQPKISSSEVIVSDNLSGYKTSVPVTQGNLSSENAKKLSELLQELEEQEREKQSAQIEQQQAIEASQERIAKEAQSELHALFSQFENRLLSLVDKTMQEKLHETIIKLEEVLNSEIKQAVAEQVDALKSNDEVIESAFEELSRLEESALNPEQFKKEESSLKEQVKELDDEIKAIPPSLYFRLYDGRILKNKQDLLLALQTMPDSVFSHHVNNYRNDFADWLELALQDPVGAKLRGASKNQMIAILSQD